MKKYDYLKLDWELATEETIFKPGMVVELRNGDQFIVGNLIPTKYNPCILLDAGCGCCSSDYLVTYNPPYDITQWAWLCESLC